MCLILIAIHPNDEYQLVVAANRDEFYKRPSLPAHFWDEEPDLLAGKDTQAGGTWLGITRNGRFAAVTNFAEEPPDPLPPRSRGELTSDFLMGTLSPSDYVETVASNSDEYRGFNLLVGQGDKLCYFGNRDGHARTLTRGFYGLSNQLLDCDCPKVIEGRLKVTDLLTNSTNDPTEALFEVLTDGGDGRDHSNSFISLEEYGTRAATVLLIKNDRTVVFEERNFVQGGKPSTAERFEFNCTADS